MLCRAVTLQDWSGGFDQVTGLPRLGSPPLLSKVAPSKALSNSPLSSPLESAALADTDGRDLSLQKVDVVADCSANPFAPLLAELVKDLGVRCPQAAE
ncbi:hypothetical protein Nepgr_019616 [Nepenthes gracilis]|uniref:Uncharacterized protein n=1 Tax=Nepenthes gracilis TaxID=150966 RepID=A0AAD3XVE4_NEPGR|nr:hypothetical protein Nepgr_019616 [Nepenthes gracilis]